MRRDVFDTVAGLGRSEGEVVVCLLQKVYFGSRGSEDASGRGWIGSFRHVLRHELLFLQASGP